MRCNSGEQQICSQTWPPSYGALYTAKVFIQLSFLTVEMSHCKDKNHHLNVHYYHLQTNICAELALLMS